MIQGGYAGEERKIEGVMTRRSSYRFADFSRGSVSRCELHGWLVRKNSPGHRIPNPSNYNVNSRYENYKPIPRTQERRRQHLDQSSLSHRYPLTRRSQADRPKVVAAVWDHRSDQLQLLHARLAASDTVFRSSCDKALPEHGGHFRLSKRRANRQRLTATPI